MNTDSSRLRWFCVSPFDAALLGKLAEGMMKAKYDDEEGYGYILGDVRKAKLTGRFIQKLTITRSTIEPNGREHNYTFQNYETTHFIVRESRPNIELLNPTRKLAEFFTSIGDMLENKVAIKPIEASCAAWIAALKATGCTITATKLITESISLSNSVSVKASFAGGLDVRSEAASFLKPRQVRPDSVSGVIEFERDTAKFKLTSKGVFCFLSQAGRKLTKAVRMAAGAIAAES